MIDIRNAPSISGLKFRHFQGERDYSQVSAVLTFSQKADQVERNVTAEYLAKAYQHLSNCDPYSAIIIAEVAGEMAGYSRGWREDEAIGRLYEHNGFLVPEWRLKGIAKTKLLWMENHFRDIAASNPPGTANFFQVNITQFQKGTAVMLEGSGYQPIRYFYEMVRPTLDYILELALPVGVAIRPANADHCRAIWTAVNETSQEEWGYRERTEHDYQEWLTSSYFQRHLWQVAWDTVTNQVVGCVLTYINDDENKQFNRRRGYAEGIGVVRSWRRRGLARALISRSLQAQKSAGMTESALVVDSDSTSNATRLYESCGFQIIKRDTIYGKPFK